MSEASFPPVAELVPHAGPMLLLARVLEHGPEQTVCEVRVDDAQLFADDAGCVPVWLALEYMAQCVAAHGGLAARASGAAPRPGLFLGTRRARFSVARFRVGQRLRVSARPLRQSALGLLAAACDVLDAESRAELAKAQLNVYVSDDLESLMRETSRGA